MKIKKTSLVALTAAIALVVGVTTAFATSAKAGGNLEDLDRRLNAADTYQGTATLTSYVDPQDGKTYYSFDGGKTFEPLTDEEFAARFPTPKVEWWTYDEYKAWLENEKIELQDMIGERAWTSGRGEFVWTQEIVDEAIAMYEEILENIGRGMLYSKTIDGEADTSLMMSMNPADIWMDTHEPQQPIQPEPAAPAPENRWGVPDGEIPEFMNFAVESFEDGAELGTYLERTHSLYPGDYSSVHVWPSDTYYLQVHYEEKKIRERLIDGAYPVNSKGETYGSALDHQVVGYDPDLIAVQAANGVNGYALRDAFRYCGYPGPMNGRMEDWDAYFEWQKSQPKPLTIPVYDVEHDNVVGYFEIGDGRLSTDTSGMSPEEVRELVRNGVQ